MDHLVGVAGAGQHHPQRIPAIGAVARLLLQLPLHRAQRVFAVVEGAGGEFEDARLHGKAVLAQQHHPAVGEHRHRQGGAGVADDPELPLHPHRQLDPVHLEADLARIELGDALQMPGGLGRR